jgi:hypothetical protein
MNRDVHLDEWLDGIGFKPANSLRKQLGHEAARQQIAEVGRLLHGLLPPGRDKSLVFTLLEDVLMRANRALAIGDGPNATLETDVLQRLAAHGPLEQDPRVEDYKAEQRGEASAAVQEMERANLAPAGFEDVDPTGPETLRLGFTDTAGTVFEITGEHASQGGYVQVATTVPIERWQQYEPGSMPAFTDGRDGWWHTIDSPTTLNALLAGLARAGELAFGTLD